MSAGVGQDLEEVLKEKGVITEADVKEVAASKPVAYQPGKGFYVHILRPYVPALPRGEGPVSIPVRGQGRRERPGPGYQRMEDPALQGVHGRLCVHPGPHVSRPDGPGEIRDGADAGRCVDQLSLRRRGTAPGGPVQDAVLPRRAHLRRGAAVRGQGERRGRLQAQLRYRRDGAGKTAGGKLAYSAGLFNGTGQSGTRTTNSGPGPRASSSTPSGRCGTARRIWRTPRAPPLSRCRLLREHAEAEREHHIPRHHHIDSAVRRNRRVAR